MYTRRGRNVQLLLLYTGIKSWVPYCIDRRTNEATEVDVTCLSSTVGTVPIKRTVISSTLLDSSA